MMPSCLEMMSLTVENVFMENNIFRECVFGR